MKHNHYFSFILAAFLFLNLALLLMPAVAGAASLPLSAEVWIQLEGPLDGPAGSGQTAHIPMLAITHTNDPYATAQVPLSSGFDFPVGGLNHEGFDMINCFGCGVDWLGDYGHTAEDYENGRDGDPVYAASEGVVLWSGVGPVAYGNVLIVQHNVQGKAVFTLYAHLRDVYAVPGQTVGRRQQIATVGQSGSFMPHLHFEMRNQPMIANRGYTFYPFEGATTIDAYGMTFYQPTWYINNHRHLDSPFGRVDRTKRIPGGFQVSGWAFDPNTPAFIAVHVYEDNQLASIVAASEERPDIGASFPGRGTAHGFSANVGAAAGNHSYCAYAINAGPGSNNLINCGSFYVNGNPVGNLESAAADTNGQLHISGWALDPDSASSIDVHVYVNGRFAAAASATGDRGDIATAYPEYGALHGYTVSVPILAADSTVCAYGINTAGGDNALLGCKTVHNGWDSFPVTTVIAYKQGASGTPKKVVVSQRVLWKGFFNETLGTVLP